MITLKYIGKTNDTFKTNQEYVATAWDDNRYYTMLSAPNGVWVDKKDFEIVSVKSDMPVTLKLNDPVNSPSHYKSNKFEAIEIIEDYQLNFGLGNTVKYILRAGKKDPRKTVEDLEKAAFYLNREIQKQKKKQERLQLLDEHAKLSQEMESCCGTQNSSS